MVPEADKNAEELLELARACLIEISEEIKCDVLTIIYNPYSEGIKTPFSKTDKDDAWYLNAVIEHADLKKAHVILHGQGGDFNVGIKMAWVLRNKLQKYITLVPSICASALCFSILRSDQLELSENSVITQIDPLYEENGQWLRAIETQYDLDEERRLKAKKILSACKEWIMKLIKEKPSLYNHDIEDWEEFYDAERIADIFMWKSDHMENVSYKEMLGLNLKVKLLSNEKLLNLMNKYKEICQELLLWEDRRVLIGCSKKYSYREDEEGNFLRLK